MFPTVMTNIIVTALVAIKVRCVLSLSRGLSVIIDLGLYNREYRRDIKRNLGQATKTRLEKFLVLLVESGCVYSAIWVRCYLNSSMPSYTPADRVLCHRHLPLVSNVAVLRRTGIWSMGYNRGIYARHGGEQPISVLLSAVVRDVQG